MKTRESGQAIWRSIPVIGFFVMEWQLWRKEQVRPCYQLASLPSDASELLPYPLDMQSLLALPYGSLDAEGIPYNFPTGLHPATYHPTTIIQFGLANWNAYLATNDDEHRQAFIRQVDWLLAHEVQLPGDSGGWPMPFSVSDYGASAPWLSALTQGNAISAFVYAYQLTKEDVYLQAARRAAHLFAVDIRDGGVSASLDEGGIFFEEVAVYPAAHILNGYLFALIGLYDYVALANDTGVAALVQRSHATLHRLINRFDTGYWTCYDLLYKTLASRFYHSLHTALLASVAHYSGCEECAKRAREWTSYTYHIGYYIAARFTRYRYRFRHLGIRRALSRLLGVKGRVAFKEDPVMASSFLYQNLSDKNSGD